MLNGGADVFRCIAAEWKSIDVESVQDSLRQQAKQVWIGRIAALQFLVFDLLIVGALC